MPWLNRNPAFLYRREPGLHAHVAYGRSLHPLVAQRSRESLPEVPEATALTLHAKLETAAWPRISRPDRRTLPTLRLRERAEMPFRPCQWREIPNPISALVAAEAFAHKHGRQAGLAIRVQVRRFYGAHPARPSKPQARSHSKAAASDRGKCRCPHRRPAPVTIDRSGD